MAAGELCAGVRVPLSEEDIDLVRASLRLAARQLDAIGMLFYHRLFEIAPEVRPLFAADIQAQCGKLMSMLGTVVAELHDEGILNPLLADMARRHVGYGAVPEHYPLVGQALIWALGQTLGARFTPAMREAWVHAFESISQVMLDAVETGGEARGAEARA